MPNNIAIAGSIALTGDAEFANIDFTKTYHDSAPRADQMNEIHSARMAEAVVRDRINLDHCGSVLVRND